MALSDQYKEIADTAEADFTAFVALVAPYLHLGSIHDEVMEWLIRHDGKDNKLVLLPRAHLKSRVAALLVTWILTKNPEETILYVSSTAALAEAQLYQIKQILESRVYRKYWPNMIHEDEGKRERWTVAEICVDHPQRKVEGIRDPSIKAIGITGSTTGFHASKVVLDDLVVPTNAYTEEGRRKVAALYSQLASIENPGAMEYVFGTRYHPRDLYGSLMEMTEILDADDGETEEIPVYEVFQRVVEEHGEFLWPKSQRKDGKWFGFDDKVLARIKAKYKLDIVQFYAQYYNDPNKGEGGTVSNAFQYYDKAAVKYKEGTWYIGERKINIYAAIDFAFSKRKTADYTAIVVIGIDYLRNYYVLDIERFRTDKIKDYFDKLVKLYNIWGFRKLRAEISVAQQTIVKELKESYIKPAGMAISILEYRPTRHEGSKEERMEAILGPKYDNGAVWHYRGGNCQILEEELTARNPPHDDVKDGLANACEIAIAPHQYTFDNGRNVVQLKTHNRFGGMV